MERRWHFSTQVVIGLLSLLLTGCPPPVPPDPPGPPPADADPTACDEACFVIKAKCPKTKLAEDRDCPSACKKVEGSGYVTMHATCIAKSVTADDVRKCNFDCKE